MCVLERQAAIWYISDPEGVSAVGALQARTEGAAAVAATRLFAARVMISSNSEGSNAQCPCPSGFSYCQCTSSFSFARPSAYVVGRNAIANNLYFSVIGMSLAKTIIQLACMLTNYLYMASWLCGASSLQPQHEYLESPNGWIRYPSLGISWHHWNGRALSCETICWAILLKIQLLVHPFTSPSHMTAVLNSIIHS